MEKRAHTVNAKVVRPDSPNPLCQRRPVNGKPVSRLETHRLLKIGNIQWGTRVGCND